MTEQSTSPLPVGSTKQVNENLGTTFDVVINFVVQGKKIHKLEWEDKDYFGFLNEGILSLHKPDGNNYQWIINDGDLMGNDWIVLD